MNMLRVVIGLVWLGVLASDAFSRLDDTRAISSLQTANAALA